MTRLRIAGVSRAVLLAAIALGLLAGPVAAACVSCCPASGDPATIVAPPACCGDCSSSVAPVRQPSSQILPGLAPIALLLLSMPLAAAAAMPPPAAIPHSAPQPQTRCGPPGALVPLRL